MKIINQPDLPDFLSLVILYTSLIITNVLHYIDCKTPKNYVEKTILENYFALFWKNYLFEMY